MSELKNSINTIKTAKKNKLTLLKNSMYSQKNWDSKGKTRLIDAIGKLEGYYDELENARKRALELDKLNDDYEYANDRYWTYVWYVNNTDKETFPDLYAQYIEKRDEYLDKKESLESQINNFTM